MKNLSLFILSSFILSSTVFAIDSDDVRVMSTKQKRDAGISVTSDPRFPNVLPSSKVEEKYSIKNNSKQELENHSS